MGLIARQAEAAGIPTLSMSSARDITAAVHPPRAVYLDWPLGHTAGRANQPETNLEVMRATLAAFERITRPGEIVDLGIAWAENDHWKDSVMRPRPTAERAATAVDSRVERHDTPQFQSDDDAVAAADRHGAQDCMVCAGIDY